MSSGARQPGKVVPWTGFGEWAFVKDCLYADLDDPGFESLQRKGIAFVRMWAFRGKIPTAVEATGNFVSLRLRLLYFKRGGCVGFEGIGVDESEMQVLRLAMTMALVRFVNEMVDPLQKGTYAQPITKLAEQIGLPRNLVDLRHEGTHDELPSVGVLELAIEQAMAWLRQTYWEPLLNSDKFLLDKCRQALERLAQQLTCTIPLYRSWA